MIMPTGLSYVRRFLIDFELIYKEGSVKKVTDSDKPKKKRRKKKTTTK